MLKHKKKHLLIKLGKSNKKAPFLAFYGAEFSSRAGGLWRTFTKFLVQQAILRRTARAPLKELYQGYLRDKLDIFIENAEI